MFTLVVLQQQPHQEFLLKGPAPLQLQGFQQPAHPVLQGVLVDKQLGRRLGDAAPMAVIALRRLEQEGQLALPEGVPQPGIELLQKIRVPDGRAVQQVIAAGGRVPQVAHRPGGDGLQGGGLLGRVFDNVCQSGQIARQPLEHFHIHEDGGLSGMIHGETVLVGPPAFMRRKAVRLPAKLPSRTAVCLAVDGELAAMFGIKYTAADTVELALRTMRRNGLLLTLATRDGLISPKLLRARFGADFGAERLELSDRLALSDPEREEELVDKSGHRCFVRRKEIIRAFLEYVISCATQRFKCRFKSIHISAPVKQKKLFVRLFKDILPDYEIEEEDMLDEGVAVLYNSISDLIAENKYENNEARRALIIDCGGGTTDLSSCCFIINNQRVAYRIQIATAYENGDTDFGGNNLTFRIMEMLKISLARQLDGTDGPMPEEILEGMGEDIFRETDTCGVKGVYRLLDEEYAKAEAVIPTRFREYEHRSNAEYYAVKNNFYYLFGLAEQIKKAFYGKRETLRIAVSGVQIRETATRCLLADRFKLSVLEGNRFQVLKDIPTVYFSISALDKLLKADIYGIVKKFIGTSYESGDLQEYSIMRLTGQSCRIALFREALKEFIPGKIIESSRRERSGQRGYELKLMCLDGAVKYIRDRRFGYADVRIIHEHAAFPYAVTAYTHTGEEKVLIEGLDRENTGGFISRNMADLTLQLYLRDTDGAVRYQYYCAASPDTFLEAEAEQIVEKYPDGIRQDDVDAIVDRELRFFVLADEERWGFIVVPVLRSGEQLMLGEERFFLFETEGWLTNFFDGTK